MDIRVVLSVGADPVKEETLTIEDEKLEPLSEEEVERAIEIVIRDWADKLLSISWEVLDGNDQPEESDE
jgi:hypothetical protein